MNLRQNRLIIKLCLISSLTIIFIAGTSQYKSILNKSEAIRAMNILSREIAYYRIMVGTFPSKDYIDGIIEKQSLVRLGSVNCRARWIEPGSTKETIFLFSRKNYKMSFVKSGYVFLTIEDIQENVKLIELRKTKKQLEQDVVNGVADAKQTILNIDAQIAELIAAGKDGNCQWAPIDSFMGKLARQQNEAEVDAFLKQQKRIPHKY